MKMGKLLPNNGRMKRLIKDFGDTWEIIHIRNMPCFNGQLGVQVQALSDRNKISNIKPEDVEISG